MFSYSTYYIDNEMAVLHNAHHSSVEISTLLDSWVTNTPSVKMFSLHPK